MLSRFKRKPPSSPSGSTATTGLNRQPGTHEAAVASEYFNRGSREAIEGARWRLAFFVAGGVAAMEGLALKALLPLKTVETVALSKDENSRMQIAGVAGQVSLDDDVKMAWCSDWVAQLTEITPITWERNINRAAGRTVGVATDQVSAYLRRSANNPALLLRDNPNYVREYERIAVNKITADVFLVRYRLTSRARPGAAPEIRSYAMTITVAQVKHSSREDVYRNPSGLVATTFSLAEEG